MSYFSQYPNQFSERAGLNAYGPVACAFSIFGIVSLVLIFIVVIPTYLLYLLHVKTTIDKTKLPKDNTIQQTEFCDW